MGEINSYVQINIDRSTKTPTQASFSIPGVVGQFPANKTVTPFGRARSYRNLKALEADGFTEKDSIYAACRSAWKQSPSVERIIVGRLDAGDLTVGAGLSAIAEENADWYAFTVVGTYTPTIVFSQALVSGNVIKSSFNGVALADITYSGSSEATLGALEAAIEVAFPGAVATVSGTSISVTLAGNELIPVVTVTGGASQPTVTVTWAQDTAKVEAIADWVETQMKAYFYDTTDAGTYSSASTTDIFAKLKAKGYDRSMGTFKLNPGEYFAAGQLGEALPFDPGSSTLAYKTVKGSTADNLGSTKEDVILSKNGNVYTSTAGISHTFEGKAASGEYMDVIFGMDWIAMRMKERIFSNRVNKRKVPLSDPGLETEGTIIKSVGSEAEGRGILVDGTFFVSVPKADSIPDADKGVRLASGFEFGGKIEGAIHKSKIGGNLFL